MAESNTYPKLHNAMWPGVVGKGAPDSEPIIPLDTLLELTAKAEVDGQKFDGVDLFVVAPHFDIDSTPDDVKKMADHIAGYGLKVGSFVAPIWGGAGGGSAMGDAEERKRFLDAVQEGLRHRQADARNRHPADRRRADRFLGQRRGLGQGPRGQHQADRRDLSRGRQDRRRTTASSSSPRARSAGAACSRGARTSSSSRWSACPAWSATRPTWPTTMLFVLGANAEKDRLLPADFDWSDKAALDAAYKKVADALRPWTLDFHVAQNDGTVFGSGTHAETGRHCQVTDRTAGSTSSSTPATGCATRTATSPRRCGTSAGTAACSPTR